MRTIFHCPANCPFRCLPRAAQQCLSYIRQKKKQEILSFESSVWALIPEQTKQNIAWARIKNMSSWSRCVCASFLLLSFGALVRSKCTDEIEYLLGISFDVKFKHYSGYLQASETRFLHYWYAYNYLPVSRLCIVISIPPPTA